MNRNTINQKRCGEDLKFGVLIASTKCVNYATHSSNYVTLYHLQCGTLRTIIKSQIKSGELSELNILSSQWSFFNITLCNISNEQIRLLHDYWLHIAHCSCS